MKFVDGSISYDTEKGIKVKKIDSYPTNEELRKRYGNIKVPELQDPFNKKRKPCNSKCGNCKELKC